MALLDLKSVSLGFAGNRVLQDVNHPERGAYLSRFADHEVFRLPRRPRLSGPD